jgi:phytoene dehydrogenase-like protein
MASRVAHGLSMTSFEYDAVVVGSGPNGLAAAIRLAENGWKTIVFEAKDTCGGGLRTLELTQPGFRHDVCSAIHPLARSSPYFATLNLERFGLEWIQPPIALAHPMPDQSVVAMETDLGATVENLGIDGEAYRHWVSPFAKQSDEFFSAILRPVRIPRRPVLLSRFGLRGLPSISRVARKFQLESTKGMLAGMAAHSMLPLDYRLTAGVALLFCVSVHSSGWPFPRGGSQSLCDALMACLKEHKGEIVTGRPIQSMAELPPCRAILFDVTPRQLLTIAGDRFSSSYRRGLAKFRPGPGVFKLDYALSQPVPWTAESCRRAGTVHVGGTFGEIAAAEADANSGRANEQPFVLVAQQSLFDDSRAPLGEHTLWAYCHVARGSTVDMTERIEQQIERFAPGFRQTIVDRRAMECAQLEAYNANYIAGDITSGAMDFWQTIARPTWRWDPYATSDRQIFICSASTPPGPGVHGMCGYHAAQSVLRRNPRSFGGT